MQLSLQTDQERAVVAKALQNFIDRWEGIESASDIEVAKNMLEDLKTTPATTVVMRKRNSFITPVSTANSQAYSTFSEGDVIR